MVCLGVVVALGGVWWLWGPRLRRMLGTDTGNVGSRPPGARLPLVGRVSEATRLLVGLSALIAGYHLVVWALPASETSLQFPRERWWALVAIGVLVIWGSVIMDRRDAARVRGSAEGRAGGQGDGSAEE